MMKAKVFERNNASVGSVRYCVDSMHIHVTTFLGAVISRTVTACDDSCKAIPTIMELDCPENTLQKLREKLDAGVDRLKPEVVG